MANTPRLQPNAALAEILEATGELDRILSGQGLTFDSPPAPPVTPPQPFHIPAPNWDEEERERQALEAEQQRQARAAILAEELARIEDQEPYPATKTRRWRP